MKGGVAAQAVGRGVTCPLVSPRMQALVLLLWTGALLGHGSSQNVASSSEVSRVGSRSSSSSSEPAKGGSAGSGVGSGFHSFSWFLQWQDKYLPYHSGYGEASPVQRK